MRIDQTAFCFVETLQIGKEVFPLLVNRLILVAYHTVFNRLVLQFPVCVASLGKFLPLGLVKFVLDPEFFSRLDSPGCFVAPEAGYVRLEHSVLNYAVGNLESWVYELYLVFASLEHRFVSNLDKFVDVAKARVVLAGCNGISHSVGIYAGTLLLNFGYQVLVKGVCCKYLAVLQAGIVQ